MAITVTEKAARHIQKTLDKRGKGFGLRLALIGDDRRHRNAQRPRVALDHATVRIGKMLERETVEGDAVNALLDNEWDAYLEREGDILAAKEERNAKAAGMPTKKRAPRMSEEELAADAAAFAQAAMQEDTEAASDDAGDDCAVNADTDTDK